MGTEVKLQRALSGLSPPLHVHFMLHELTIWDVINLNFANKFKGVGEFSVDITAITKGNCGYSCSHHFYKVMYMDRSESFNSHAHIPFCSKYVTGIHSFA